MTMATINGVELSYEERGAGEPLVMIHGAATSGRMFADAAGVLEDEYRLIIPDLRGMGNSERITSMEPTAWVRDLEGLLDFLDLHAAHLLGCSLGARIVARLAVEAPERVLSLVVDAPIIAMEQGSNQALNAHLSNVSDDSPSANSWREQHGDDWREVVTNYFALRNDPALQDYLSVRSDVAGMQVPTLISRGDIDEPVHPLAHCFEWHQLVPTSWMWIAPNVGPSAVMSQPQEFKVLFRRFLEAATTPAKSA